MMKQQKPVNEEAILDDYEQAIEDSFDESTEYSMAVKREKMKQAKEAATNHIKTKDKRISIRVYGDDLERIKEIAREEGLPYQTLITSILHKFSTGLLASTRGKNNHN